MRQPSGVRTCLSTYHRPQKKIWLVPSALGVLGAAFAGTVAVRWARRRPEAPQDRDAPAARDAYQAQLDEELRDLD